MDACKRCGAVRLPWMGGLHHSCPAREVPRYRVEFDDAPIEWGNLYHLAIQSRYARAAQHSH